MCIYIIHYARQKRERVLESEPFEDGEDRVTGSLPPLLILFPLRLLRLHPPFSSGSFLLILSYFSLFSFYIFVFRGKYFTFSILSQNTSTAKLRSTLSESVNEGIEYNSLTPGETGDNSVTSIPFQVLGFAF